MIALILIIGDEDTARRTSSIAAGAVTFGLIQK
jgi:hypothetical protein